VLQEIRKPINDELQELYRSSRAPGKSGNPSTTSSRSSTGALELQRKSGNPSRGKGYLNTVNYI
jgi:hypothetical protein